MTSKAIDAVIAGEPEIVLTTRGGLVMRVRPVPLAMGRCWRSSSNGSISTTYVFDSSAGRDK